MRTAVPCRFRGGAGRDAGGSAAAGTGSASAAGGVGVASGGGEGRGSAAMEAPGKGGLVLGNLAEVVERVLGFLPTKALLRAAW